MCSVDGVTIRHNQFIRAMSHADDFGRDKGIDPA